MLTFTTADALRAEPDPHRFWILAILLALREEATRLELRFGDGTAMLYHRVAGRDWEISVVEEDLFPDLKPTLRTVARLVSPERPGFTVTAGLPVAREERQEIGWLTFSLDQRLIDLPVRLDPREPYGFVEIAIEYPEEAELGGLAGEALSDYYNADSPE